MNKKILVLDLDGTLLSSEKQITSATMEALRKLQQAGHIIVLASGRPEGGIQPVAERLELEKYDGYVLAFNGAKVIDWKSRKVLFQQTIEHQYLQALYDAAKKHHLTILTYNNNDAIAGTAVNKYADFEIRINQMKLQEVEDFTSYVDFPIIKCLMAGEPEQVATCEKELLKSFGDRLGIFRSEDFFLEIVAQNIDKGASVERLVQHLGGSRANVVCCGDAYNDIPMIRYAGVGVAMANAKDAVKREADVIAGLNDADGLVPIIEKYFLEAGEEY